MKILNSIFILLTLFVTQLSAQSASFEWAAGMGASQSDNGTGVAMDNAGNTYFTGYFQGTVDFNPGAGVFNLTSQGSNDIFLVKLNVNGNFVWAKSIGGTADERSTTIISGSGNTLLVGGTFTGTTDFDPGAGVVSRTAQGFTDGFLVKLDTSGVFQSVLIAGGSGIDEIKGVTYNGLGIYAITGYFESTLNFLPGGASLVSAGSYDMFVAGVDHQLNPVWTKSMGGLTRNFGTAVAADAVGNIYAAGYFNGTGDYNPGTAVFNLTTNGSYDALLMKLTASGDFLWAINAGSGTDDAAHGIDVSAGGEVYVTGYFSGSADFDPGTGVNTITATGMFDSFILKSDSNGVPVWIKTLGGSGTSQTIGTPVLALSSGDVIIGGTFTGTVDMNPGNGVVNFTASGDEDGFAVRLTSQGVFVEAYVFGSAGIDAVQSMAASQGNTVVVAGTFTGTMDADPTSGLQQLVSSGMSDAFVVTLGTSFTTVPEVLKQLSPKIYPNPSSDYIMIGLPETLSDLKLTISNVAGSVMVEEFYGEFANRTIEVGNWDSGVYIVTLEGGQQKSVLRFVKL